MVNKNLVTIKLKDHLPAFISSRQAAKMITQKCFRKISEQDKRKLVLDFKGIYFVSRSFADEIMDSVEKLENRDIEVRIKNDNPSISQMLEVVRRSRARVA